MKNKINITSYHVSNGKVDTLYFNYLFHSYVAEVSPQNISIFKKDAKRTNVALIDRNSQKLSSLNGLDDIACQTFEKAVVGTVNYINENSIIEYLNQ